MTRITQTFESLDRPALVTFITAGDPDYDKSLSVMKALPGAGADIIELGMPFTDPMADGEVIQAAGLRALKAGGNMKQTLQMVRDFRTENTDTPVVLMGYANPVYAYGLEDFAKDAVEAGVDGLIIVDLPPEEDGELRKALAGRLDMIRLITPTTDEERLSKVLDGASGFLYYVSVTGVTGAAKADINAISPHINTIRKHTDLPIAIGFGVKTPEDVQALAKIGDAVVVGSAIVQNIADHAQSGDTTQAIEKQVKNLSSGLKN